MSASGSASRLGRWLSWRNLAKVGGVSAIATGAALYGIHRYINPTGSPYRQGTMKGEEILVKDLPSRTSMLHRLKASEVREDEIYDILVIGGGSGQHDKYNTSIKQANQLVRQGGEDEQR